MCNAWQSRGRKMGGMLSRKSWPILKIKAGPGRSLNALWQTKANCLEEKKYPLPTLLKILKPLNKLNKKSFDNRENYQTLKKTVLWPSYVVVRAVFLKDFLAWPEWLSENGAKTPLSTPTPASHSRASTHTHMHQKHRNNGKKGIKTAVKK